MASAGLIFASLREALTMGCQRELVYWGQDGGNEREQRDGSLSNEDIRIILLGAGHGARNDEDKMGYFFPIVN